MAKAEDGIAAILNADLKSIGMGVVVDPFHVITCSHVVNEALGHDKTRQEHPGDDERIQIIFPYSLKTARTEPATGRVRAWHPVFLGKGLRPEMHDVAVVQLSERVTDDVGIAELSSGDPPPDTRFDVYRHVTGNPSGIPATGETRTKAENGFIALFGTSFVGKYIEPGFSGASCWSAGKTVGIVVTSWEDTSARVAHMIPSSTLRKALNGVVVLPNPLSADDGVPADPTTKPPAVEFRFRFNSCAGNITIFGVIVVGIFLTVPAIQKVREAAAPKKLANNYKQISLATFESMNEKSPRLLGPFVDRKADGAAVSYPADESRRLSWRVALLPYLEQADLYRMFDLDQAWDSEVNRPRADNRIGPLVDPNDGGTKTRVRTFYDGGAVFDSDPAKRIGPANIPGGSSNTILYVEATEAVTWTQFNDFKFDPTGPLPPLGHPKRSGMGFFAVMADGSVRFIAASAQQEVVKAAISRGGEGKSKLAGE